MPIASSSTPSTCCERNVENIARASSWSSAWIAWARAKCSRSCWGRSSRLLWILGQERGAVAPDAGALADAEVEDSLREGINDVPLSDSGCRTSVLGLTFLSSTVVVTDLLLLGIASGMSSSSPPSSSPESSPSKIPGRMFQTESSPASTGVKSSSSSSGTGGRSWSRIGIASSKTEGDGTMSSSSCPAATLLASKKDCCPPSLTMSAGTIGSPLRTACAKASDGLAILTFCEATKTGTFPHNNHKFLGPSWPITLEVGDQDVPPLWLSRRNVTKSPIENSLGKAEAFLVSARCTRLEQSRCT